MSRRVLFVIAVLLITGVWPSVHALPIVELPPLTGEYQVGRAAYHLIDESREEVLTDGAGDIRELVLTIYFPAQPGPDDQPAPYVEGALKEHYP